MPVNKFSHVPGFCIYIRCTTRRHLSCGILLHPCILIIFLFWIPCGYGVFSDKKTGIFLLYTRISRKSQVNSLIANDLLKFKYASTILGDDHLILKGGGLVFWSRQIIYFHHGFDRKIYFRVNRGQNIYFQPQQIF